MPKLTCRAGFLDVEQLHGLPTVRAAIQEALEQNDPAALTFLTERLPEVIGSDAHRALQTLVWAEAAPVLEAIPLLEGLREAAAVKDPHVAERLLVMAEGHPNAAHRAQALVTLETQARFEPAVQERLVALAKQAPQPSGTSLLAVRTLGRVMRNDFQATGVLEPALSHLLSLARESTDSNARALAVEMVTAPSARLDEHAVTQLAWVLMNDPNASVRELAALALSTGRDTEAVLRRFQQAFRSEQSLCVRWSILRYTLRAGGAEALPQVRDYADQDRRLQRDFADFQALYAAGNVDFDRLWLNKRVYHRCPEDAEGARP